MEFQRVGGHRSVSVDVRVIAATHRNLLAMVRDHLFREDLWFRLNVFPIPVPPLRSRREDIPDMARYFVRQKAREMNLDSQPAIPREAMIRLQTYDWPGNIRELQNIIERALIVYRGGVLTFPDLAGSVAAGGAESQAMEDTSFPTLDDMMIRHIKQALAICEGRIDGNNGAARRLGINPSTLRGRMRKFGITTRKIVV
jgi:transcriptional regulator with GAF, ATPase, and Fis domain